MERLKKGCLALVTGEPHNEEECFENMIRSFPGFLAVSKDFEDPYERDEYCTDTLDEESILVICSAERRTAENYGLRCWQVTTYTWMKRFCKCNSLDVREWSVPEVIDYLTDFLYIDEIQTAHNTIRDNQEIANMVEREDALDDFIREQKNEEETAKLLSCSYTLIG